MPKQPFSQRLEDISANLESLANEIVSYAQDVRNSQTMQESPTPEAYLGTLRYDALLQSLKNELSRTRVALEKAQHDAERYKRRIDAIQKEMPAKGLRALRCIGGIATIGPPHRLVHRRIDGVLFKKNDVYFLIDGQYFEIDDPHILFVGLKKTKEESPT